METNTANRPPHEREKHTQISSLQINLSHKYSLVDFELPSGTVAQCQWPSGHLETAGTSRKHPGKHKHFRDDPLACWQTSGMAGTLAQ